MPKKTKSKPSTRRKTTSKNSSSKNSSSKNSSKNSLNNALSNLDITDALLIIIAVLVVYYLLMNNCNNGSNSNSNSNTSEGYTNNNNSKPTMMLFHAKWCGHCKTLMPEWKKFKEQANIDVIEYEADEDPDKMSENDVKGFPTIKCSTSSGDVKEFQGERTVAGLNAFAEECSK
jgi:thiol-disulfide isomerase/thioredoxin